MPVYDIVRDGVLIDRMLKRTHQDSDECVEEIRHINQEYLQHQVEKEYRSQYPFERYHPDRDKT